MKTWIIMREKAEIIKNYKELIDFANEYDLYYVIPPDKVFNGLAIDPQEYIFIRSLLNPLRSLSKPYIYHYILIDSI